MPRAGYDDRAASAGFEGRRCEERKAQGRESPALINGICKRTGGRSDICEKGNGNKDVGTFAYVVLRYYIH